MRARRHLREERSLYFHTQLLINEIAQDEPDPAAASALQEGLGGQFGEMRTMMQYLFQSMNCRGAAAKPYRDLIQGIGTEEISHVELIGTTIFRLLDGSPRYQGKPADPLYNLMLESTGRLQKCRIYEMTDNATARSSISYLIVRDQAHENVTAKAIETLGVNWKTLLPIPKTNAEKFPEVKRLVDLGLQSKQYTFDLAGQSEAGKIYRGMSPSNDGTELDARAGAGRGSIADRAGASGRVRSRARPGAARAGPGDRRPRAGRCRRHVRPGRLPRDRLVPRERKLPRRDRGGAALVSTYWPPQGRITESGILHAHFMKSV